MIGGRLRCPKCDTRLEQTAIGQCCPHRPAHYVYVRLPELTFVELCKRLGIPYGVRSDAAWDWRKEERQTAYRLKQKALTR